MFFIRHEERSTSTCRLSRSAVSTQEARDGVLPQSSPGWSGCAEGLTACVHGAIARAWDWNSRGDSVDARYARPAIHPWRFRHIHWE